MLPRSPGVVVAVVGIGTAPIALARRIADELEIDPDHIVLATPEPVSELSHPDEAQTFASELAPASGTDRRGVQHRCRAARSSAGRTACSTSSNPR